jgi:hypothetical protein
MAARTVTAKSAVAIAFHDRCDMIIATAAIGSDRRPMTTSWSNC